MISATIDVTARARIRALAARMHRAGIAGVFSVAGGALAVDEAALDADQRAQAALVLDEVAAATLTVVDVEEAVRAAVAVPHYVKPSCSTCGGRGVVRRGGVDDLCGCVDRRWQADADRRAFVDALRAPGRASGVRVESTRATDVAERVASAREAIARARAASSAACADLDAAIGAREAEYAGYIAERGRVDATRVASKTRADDLDRLAKGYAKSAADAQDKVEEIVTQIGDLIEHLFWVRSTDSVDDGRAQAHAALDAVYVAAAEVKHCRVDQKAAEEVARQARDTEVACEQRIAAIDADSAHIVADVERLCAERARIARHHQPKIDRAERRLRRLTYKFGDVVRADAMVTDELGELNGR